MAEEALTNQNKVKIQEGGPHANLYNKLNITDLSSISASDKITEKGLKNRSFLPTFEESKTFVKKDINSQFVDILNKQPMIMNSLHSSPLIGKNKPESSRHTLSLIGPDVGLKPSPKDPSQDSDLLELIRFVPLVKESRCLLKTKEANRVKDSECVVFKVNQTLPDVGSRSTNRKTLDQSGLLKNNLTR